MSDDEVCEVDHMDDLREAILGCFPADVEGQLYAEVHGADAILALPQLVENELLADIMRRLIGGPHGGYVNFGYQRERPFLTLDCSISLTEAELLAVVGAEKPGVLLLVDEVPDD